MLLIYGAEGLQRTYRNVSVTDLRGNPVVVGGAGGGGAGGGGRVSLVVSPHPGGPRPTQLSSLAVPYPARHNTNTAAKTPSPNGMTITSFGGHRLRSKSAVTMSSTRSNELVETPTPATATVSSTVVDSYKIIGTN
eukprot:sb/3479368/